jgi:hypothetical protein
MGAISGTDDAIAIVGSRNETRSLRLMPPSRVNSGTGCDGVAQEPVRVVLLVLGVRHSRLQLDAERGPRRVGFPCAQRGGVSKLLDAALANELLLVAGMGKPMRNELLAEYYLRAAGVAAMWIENEPDRIVYCCERGVHFTLAYRLYEWKKAVIVDRPAIAGKLEELADLGGVGLTPLAVAVSATCWCERRRPLRRLLLLTLRPPTG